MNLITLTGNLGRDWEQANSNTVIAKNSLAVRRDFKNKQTGEYDTDWIPLTAFSKTAETLMQYTSKGSKVLIVGKLQTNNYTDKNGNKRTSYDVIVDRFEFLDSRNDNQQQSQQQNSNPFANVDFNSNDPFETNNATEIDDDSLPF
jgi:single-strand DNA-binding protein